MNKNTKPTVLRSILSVKRTEYLTPHYIRITLTGDDVALFKEATIGVNNKIFLPPTGVNEIHFPVFNENTEKWDDPPEELKPIVRTYTHRGIDLDKKEMIIDFVAHGDSGPASAWAIQAKPGDLLGVAMKAKISVLYPQADWYLLAGDATGIPVLASILESLPANAKGIAYIEVLSKDEELPLTTAADIQINWVHNPAPGENSLLSDTVRGITLPDHTSITVFGYVAAEFSNVKNIRSFLRKEKGWPQEALYAYSYWRYGKSEDGSVKERQEEKRSLS